MGNDIRLQNGALSTTQVGAYNVYTGARYVPLIAGEWDSTKNYEPLTIVINQGNSYTSAQYVPAGIPLQENGPYWFKTGNFNGQVSAVEAQVDINTTAIETINQTLTNYDSLTQNVSNLMNRTTPFNNSMTGRFFLFYGDSFGVNISPVTKAWPYVVAQNLGLPESQWLNISQGSIGFSFANTDDHSVYYDWTHKTNLPAYVTDIVIQMGANDLANTSNVYSNAINTLKTIRNQYKDANIWLCMAGYNFTSAYQYANLDRLYWQAGLQAGVKYIPRCYMCWAQGGGHQDDGVHPTNIGEGYIGNYISSYILNGQAYFQPVDMALTFTPKEGVQASCTLTQYVNFNDCHLYGNMTLTNVSGGELGTFNIPPCRSRFEFIIDGHDFSVSNGKLRLETGESGVSYNNNAFFVPFLG